MEGSLDFSVHSACDSCGVAHIRSKRRDVKIISSLRIVITHPFSRPSYVVSGF